ncbi:hypothetical protein GCM10027514_27360 [Azotobacter armeniacus]
MTPLERAAGVWGIIYGRNNRECSCGACDECEWRRNTELDERKKKLENSARFKEAAKLVAGLSGNRETKLALIQKVHQDSLESAIVRYMSKEALPEYYAAILKSPNCIDILVAGIFYKVCKMQTARTLDEQISKLSSLLRKNPSRLTAYDRVSHIQKFIHRTVDQYFGAGTARSIPVAPMKNALSAARLHLSILDVLDHRPGYISYIDSLSTATLQLEYDEPRPSTAPRGKRSWARWRVRHLRPLSYYFPEERRATLQALNSLDENIPSEQFVYEALLLYADA